MITAADPSSPPVVSISNAPMSLSVTHSSTVLTMNGTNRNSSPSVSIAGTISTALMSQPRKKLRSEKTMATTMAVPTLLTLTDGKMRDSARTVTVSAAR